MALSTQPYKGTRDFYPEDMRLRNYIFDKWRKICESFGYEEYDGPILEPLELFTAKTSEEIVNEQSYSFTDRGDRKVIMRPEMTPTVSRMVAGRRQELGYPLRMYSIPNCFRYERPQKGRLREFWQLNADLFGVEGIEADVEIIQLADALMKSFGAKPEMYKIKINSRQFLNVRISRSKPKVSEEEILGVLDGWSKNPEAARKKIESMVEYPDVIYGIMANEGLDSIEDIFLDNLKKVIKRLNEIGITSVEYDPTVVRGFSYYTDIVFEVFDTNHENNRAMFGGGRYDGLIGLFGVEPVPTVGFGMGDVTLMNFLESNSLMPNFKPTTDLVAILIGDVYGEASKLAAELRVQGLNVSIDATDRKLDKKIKAADKQGVRYALFVGENELKAQKFSLKNLATGKEENISIDEVVSSIKNS